ncbi:hypothetical protein QFZ27_006236 [Inquilinus ginsengisoli]|uniref:hypothetical protein n=1 Tax=Inquilinus ginsengisoli TaxID=363840 RepID=UPI003D1A782C
MPQQGSPETSHGLSNTLLSVRSREIAESLLAAKRRRGVPPDLHAPAPLRRLAVNDD